MLLVVVDGLHPPLWLLLIIFLLHVFDKFKVCFCPFAAVARSASWDEVRGPVGAALR